MFDFQQNSKLTTLIYELHLKFDHQIVVFYWCFLLFTMGFISNKTQNYNQLKQLITNKYNHYNRTKAASIT
jgi:hypothetical protein